jgi:NADH-quinone oxidoreductase subunit J
VMMLDVDFAELRQGFLSYLPVGALIGGILLAELLLVVGGWVIAPAARQTAAVAANVSNTEALGLVLYTKYVYFFEGAGLILLVSMIGAIVMTLQHKPQVRRQNIANQVARNRASAIDLVNVKPGQGLS